MHLALHHQWEEEPERHRQTAVDAYVCVGITPVLGWRGTLDPLTHHWTLPSVGCIYQRCHGLKKNEQERTSLAQNQQEGSVSLTEMLVGHRENEARDHLRQHCNQYPR